jgi:hypothetical protein
MALQKIYRERFKNDLGEPTIGLNSITFNPGDPVAYSSGFLTVAGASDRIVGYALEYKVTTSDNQTVAKYMPQYVRLEGVVMRFSTASLASQSNVGQYCVLSGSAGAFSVGTFSATVGQFVVEAFGTMDDGTFYVDVRAVFVPAVTAAS